mmetsp:Transcript_18867/g.51685  ORF Transcript_18867/g.51685 Transcript_18867/m.51685 type:complete len:201 (-) Transcript_18867:466-1068(-)
MQYVGMNHVPKENDSNDFSTTATTTTTIGNNPTGDLSNNDDEHKLHELHQKQGHIVSAAATGFFLAAEAGASAPVSAVAGAALMAYMAANGGDSLLEALPHHLQAPMQHVIDSFHRSNPFFGNHNHNHNQTTTTGVWPRPTNYQKMTTIPTTLTTITPTTTPQTPWTCYGNNNNWRPGRATMPRNDDDWRRPDFPRRTVG